MRQKGRVENRYAFDFDGGVLVVDILSFRIVFNLARLYLPKRIFVTAGVAGRVDHIGHDFFIFGAAAEGAGGNAGFIQHNDFDVFHLALGHFVGKFDIVRKYDTAVFFYQNNIADRGYDVFFLIVNDLIRLKREVIADDFHVAEGRDCLQFLIVFNRIGTEIDIGIFFVDGFCWRRYGCRQVHLRRKALNGGKCQIFYGFGRLGMRHFGQNRSRLQKRTTN